MACLFINLKIRQIYNNYAQTHETRRLGNNSFQMLLNFESLCDLLSDFDIVPQLIDQQVFKVFRCIPSIAIRIIYFQFLNLHCLNGLPIQSFRKNVTRLFRSVKLWEWLQLEAIVQYDQRINTLLQRGENGDEPTHAADTHQSPGYTRNMQTIKKAAISANSPSKSTSAGVAPIETPSSGSSHATSDIYDFAAVYGNFCISSW